MKLSFFSKRYTNRLKIPKTESKKVVSLTQMGANKNLGIFFLIYDKENIKQK